jgi:hypothetical protein
MADNPPDGTTHDVPVISVSVILPAGVIYDYDRVLASLTATSLKHGTKTYKGKKLTKN